MRYRDRYDWIVFGEHPAALLSGILVAKLGLSVLILPSPASQRIAHSSEGQPLDPEPNQVLGLGHSEAARGLVYECLDRVGISEAESQRIQGISSPQVLTPWARVEFSPDSEVIPWIRWDSASLMP